MAHIPTLEELNDVLPTYSDVEDEDERWTPQLILEAYDGGMPVTDIRAVYAVSEYTVYRIIQRRKRGDTIQSTGSKRWNRNRT